jgi:enoyl-CoA hydratase
MVTGMSIVTFAESGHVAVITLNRPEARNAINPEMANALGAAIDRLESDPNLRVGVLGATITEPRPVFCAGDDLREIHGEPAVTPKGGFAGFITYPRTKPIVAAVDGLATSGGCEIVLSCDLVVATTRSSFAVAEIKWGLGALAGGMIRLPRLLGRAPALDMILTGQPISSERAYQLGLVSTLTDGNVLAAALERAEVIAGFDPETIRINLQTAHKAATLHEDELWAVNQQAADAIFNSPTFAAGVAAFERRERHAETSPAGS